MSTTTIGIKIADRTYYPILETGKLSRKRLILTTVKDNQESVQIDLYENESAEMDEAQYVGSLLIEKISPTPAGDAEIELVVGLDEEATLVASAREATSGERQSLSVNLESLSENGVYDIPEFELEDDLDTWDDAEISAEVASAESSLSEDLEMDSGFEAVGAEEQEAIMERKRPIMLGLFIALGVVGIVLIAFLLFKLLEGPKVPPLQAIHGGTGLQVAETDSERQLSDAEAGKTERNDVSGGGPAVSSSRVHVTVAAPGKAASSYVQPPPETTLGGSWYWIRRGDTLWGLSSSFYRNPWLFKVIAQQNNIADPDRILAGSRIFIPRR